MTQHETDADSFTLLQELVDAAGPKGAGMRYAAAIQQLRDRVAELERERDRARQIALDWAGPANIPTDWSGGT